MKTRNIVRLAVVAGVAAWLANATMAQHGNRSLAQAFPAKLLASHSSCTTPEWPAEARRYEIEGVTLVHFQIGDDGFVSDAKVAGTSSWALLDEAALRSIVKCKFKPGLAEAGEKTFPIQFVWTLSGPPSVRPQLVAGSCAPSARFSQFQPYNRNATASDGVLLRFLVNAQGEPVGIKGESSGEHEAAAVAAADYLKSCRFAIDPTMPGEKTDTAYGRVLARLK